MEQAQRQHRIRPAVWLLLPVWLIILAFPAWVFFSQRGGAALLEGLTFVQASRVLFPLAGLYAFVFLWTQFVLGSNMVLWLKLAPGFYRFHRVFGVFTFLFAVLHPTLLALGVGVGAFLSKSFVSAGQALFVWLGQIALVLLLFTVLAGLLMRTRFLRRHWRKVHVLNYGIFVLTFVHSWNLGTDVRPTGLRFLWWFMAASAALSALGRLILVLRRRGAKKAALTVSQAETSETRDAQL